MKQSMIQNNLSQLKDIKPIVEVHDMSLYYLIAIITLILAIGIFIAYKYFTRIKKSKKPTAKQIAFEKLKKLDYSHTKEVVYCFSVEGFLFVNEKNKEQFQSLEKELENFKYKKDVENLPQKLIQEIKNFIKGIKNAK